MIPVQTIVSRNSNQTMKRILFVLLPLTFVRCSSSHKVAEVVICAELFQNNFAKISYGKYETISNIDTIKFNEVRFDCVFSALYTHKSMFDKFGMWDKAINPNN